MLFPEAFTGQKKTKLPGNSFMTEIPIIQKPVQWTGVYMIGTSVIKELKLPRYVPSFFVQSLKFFKHILSFGTHLLVLVCLSKSSDERSKFFSLSLLRFQLQSHLSATHRVRNNRTTAVAKLYFKIKSHYVLLFTVT